jgi:hypothetical protein
MKKGTIIDKKNEKKKNLEKNIASPAVQGNPTIGKVRCLESKNCSAG